LKVEGRIYFKNFFFLLGKKKTFFQGLTFLHPQFSGEGNGKKFSREVKKKYGEGGGVYFRGG